MNLKSLPLLVTLGCVAVPGASALAGEIQGRLILEDKPAAGVTVEALPYETPLEQARREARRAPAPAPLATATSAADGTFRLALALPAAAAPSGLRLGFRGPGSLPALTTGVYDVAETEDIGDVTLTRSGRLAGRVVSAKGVPIAGAEVRLETGAGGFAGAMGAIEIVPRTATTAADGSFRFDDTAATGNRIVVEAKGYATAEQSGVPEGALSRPITLSAPATLAGTVTEPGGRPAAGVLVRFEGRAVSRWAETSKDGSFRLTDLPEGAGVLIANGGAAGLAEVRGLELPRADPQPLRVTLTPAGALEGRVVDASSGRGLARVKVTTRAGSDVFVTRSGPDGSYRFQGLARGRYRVAADEPRYVPFVRDGIVLWPGETERADLPLVAGAAISGQVVDEDGRPVAGARGQLAIGGESGVAAFVREMRTGGDAYTFRTAADGSFKASRLRPGNGQRLTVTHAEHERQTVGGLDLAPGATLSRVRVVLRRGLALSGFVKDEEGNPVAGAEVRLMQMREARGGRRGMQMSFSFMPGPESMPRARSGPDGRFEFKGLSPGAEFTLVAEKPGYSDATLANVRLVEEMDPVELRLGPAAMIAGQVVDSNGTPLEGFMVQARPRGTSSPMGWARTRERTGADGLFALESVRAGEAYDVTALGPDGPGPTRDNIVAPADGIDLVVPARGRITGRVTDTQSGAPITDFEIAYSPDRGGGGVRMIVAAPRSGRRGPFAREPMHSEDGSFALEDVAPGTWEVRVYAPGYEDARVGGLVVASGKGREGVEVKMARGRVIRGRVLEATTGRGIAGATVSAETSSGGPGFRMAPFSPFDDQGGQVTDAEGVFEIMGLSQGKYTVTARHADYAEASQLVEVQEAVSTAELRMSAGGVLGGQVVTETRRPLPGAEVSLVAAGESMGRGFPGMGGQGTVTDESGRFRFEHLTSGRYTLAASLRVRSSPTLDVVLQAGEAREDLVIALAAGATVRGLVTGLPEAQRGGLNVSLSGADSYVASSRTAGDGSFEFSGVPAGPARLWAMAGDFMSSTRNASATVTVPEAGEVQVEIAFETGFTISGTLTRAGAPIAEAYVNASGQGGLRSAGARTDASGGFRLEGLEKGRYFVFASALQGGGSVRREIDVEADLTLDLEIPVARLAGTVVEAGTRQALAEATVQLEAQGEGSRLTRMSASDSAGRFALEDLEPRAYTMTVRKAGFELDQRGIQVSETGSEDLLIELRRGEGVGIQLRDGLFGVPVRGVTAHAVDAQGVSLFRGSVALDSEGRGEIPSLKPGTYTLTLDAGGYAPTRLTVTAPAPLVLVTMTPGGSLEIRAGAQTLAAGRAEFRLLAADGLPAALTVFGPADGRLVIVSSPVRFPNVAPGRYTLVPLSGTGQPRDVAITEGGATVVELP
jgi:protocatechuate 3,4-dioxygenase beta subunit